jgi:hypothetical protein
MLFTYPNHLDWWQQWGNLITMLSPIQHKNDHVAPTQFAAVTSTTLHQWWLEEDASGGSKMNLQPSN